MKASTRVQMDSMMAAADIRRVRPCSSMQQQGGGGGGGGGF
jgi:hypothetical protein